VDGSPISVGNYPYDIALSPDGSYAYVGPPPF
jgi:DNA-binding beta-propeller fold protein YncE